MAVHGMIENRGGRLPPVGWRLGHGLLGAPVVLFMILRYTDYLLTVFAVAPELEGITHACDRPAPPLTA